MNPHAKSALDIYESIRLKSGDRPSSGNSVAELTRALNDWRSKSEPLTTLSRSGPEVQLAFLEQSYDWLRLEARVDRNFQVMETLSDAIQLGLQCVPKPLPGDAVEANRDRNSARYFFGAVLLPF